MLRRALPKRRWWDPAWNRLVARAEKAEHDAALTWAQLHHKIDDVIADQVAERVAGLQHENHSIAERWRRWMNGEPEVYLLMGFPVPEAVFKMAAPATYAQIVARRSLAGQGSGKSPATGPNVLV